MIGDTMELGEIIRNRRKEKGMSQVLLGKELGLYDSDISKIEPWENLALLSETDMRYIRHFVDALIVNKKGDT